MSELRVPGERAPRSLADDLRGRTAADLAELLNLRPDLMRAQDLAQLAVMAGHDRSILLALDRLDALALQVAEVCCAFAEPVSSADVEDAFGEDADLRAAVALRFHALWAMGLLWGSTAFIPVSGLRRVWPFPCGLAPAALSAHRPMLRRYAREPQALDNELDEAPAESVEILRVLAAEGPQGAVEGADRPVSRESARTPLEWLLARDLVIATGPTTVLLPREIALRMRGGRMVTEPAYPSPSISGREHDSARVDRTAGHAAFDLVEHVRAVIDAWSREPPSVLRKGGLGVRDVTLLATMLDLPYHLTVLVVEVARAAHLIVDDEEVDPCWVPTDIADDWLELPEPQQWRVLVEAWLAMAAQPSAVGSTDASGGRLGALMAWGDDESTRTRRRAYLDLLDSLPPGVAVAQERVAAAMHDRLPRLPEESPDTLIREAEFVGLTGLGALSTAGRDVIHGRRATPIMPERVDHVVIQADLTVISGGPLRSDLARELGAIADVESTGAARVYRISEASLQRAFESGRDAPGLLAFLGGISRTPLPQALGYLIEDLGRRHGGVRLGAASAYVRCDDPAVLADIVARLDRFQLRLVAPTVAVTTAEPATLLKALRTVSAAAVLETADGAVLAGRSSRRRARRSSIGEPESVDDVVRRLQGTRPVPGVIAVIEDAIDTRTPLLLVCAGPRGEVREQVVHPIALHAGRLTAEALDGDTVVYAVERIVSVAPCG